MLGCLSNVMIIVETTTASNQRDIYRWTCRSTNYTKRKKNQRDFNIIHNISNDTFENDTRFTRFFFLNIRFTTINHWILAQIHATNFQPFENGSSQFLFKSTNFVEMNATQFASFTAAQDNWSIEQATQTKVMVFLLILFANQEFLWRKQNKSIVLCEQTKSSVANTYWYDDNDDGFVLFSGQNQMRILLREHGGYHDVLFDPHSNPIARKKQSLFAIATLLFYHYSNCKFSSHRLILALCVCACVGALFLLSYSVTLCRFVAAQNQQHFIFQSKQLEFFVRSLRLQPFALFVGCKQFDRHRAKQHAVRLLSSNKCPFFAVHDMKIVNFIHCDRVQCSWRWAYEMNVHLATWDLSWCFDFFANTPQPLSAAFSYLASFLFMDGEFRCRFRDGTNEEKGANRWKERESVKERNEFENNARFLRLNVVLRLPSTSECLFMFLHSILTSGLFLWFSSRGMRFIQNWQSPAKGNILTKFLALCFRFSFVEMNNDKDEKK